MACIGTRPLAQLCRRLGTGLKAGVDARRLWSHEVGRGLPGQRHYISRINQRIAEGDTVVDGMRDCNGYFPPLVCDLVDVGEQVGRLDDVFIQLADHYDHQLQLRRQFLAGIAWPMLQLFVAILVIGFVIWILGVIAPANDGGSNLLGLSGVSGALTFYSIVGVVLGGIALAITTVMRGWAGPIPIMLAMKIPYLGRTIQSFALSRLAWSLATALEAGMDARNSMRLALRSSQNPYYVAQSESVEESIQQGNEFNVALRDTRAFPIEFLDDLTAAEISGTHTESMEHLATQYQEQAISASKIITMITGFVVWAIIAAMMIFFIFALFMKIFQPYREAMDFVNDVW